jgi:hypothetical protein
MVSVTRLRRVTPAIRRLGVIPKGPSLSSERLQTLRREISGGNSHHKNSIVNNNIKTHLPNFAERLTVSLHEYTGTLNVPTCKRKRDFSRQT